MHTHTHSSNWSRKLLKIPKATIHQQPTKQYVEQLSCTDKLHLEPFNTPSPINQNSAVDRNNHLNVQLLSAWTHIDQNDSARTCFLHTHTQKQSTSTCFRGCRTSLCENVSNSLILISMRNRFYQLCGISNMFTLFMVFSNFIVKLNTKKTTNFELFLWNFNLDLFMLSTVIESRTNLSLNTFASLCFPMKSCIYIYINLSTNSHTHTNNPTRQIKETRKSDFVKKHKCT
jgi:hypothetical protein